MKSENKPTPQLTLPSMITTDVAITLSGKSKVYFYYAKQFDPNFPEPKATIINGKAKLTYSTDEICQYFNVEA